MKIYELKTEQLLKTDIDTAWSFFSDPANLNKITPADLKFKITSEIDSEMYSGQIITYKIGVLPLITQTWVTEIKSVQKQKFFIDEQRFGPYKFWHHKHSFEETENGVLMKDTVHYSLPFGVFGRIAHMLFVKNKLKNIFHFRFRIMKDLFNKE